MLSDKEIYYLENRWIQDFSVYEDEVILYKGYHGSPDKDIEEFDLRNVGSNLNEGHYGFGVYFTTDRDFASIFAKGALDEDDEDYEGGAVYQCELHFKNPFIPTNENILKLVNTQEFKSEFPKFDPTSLKMSRLNIQPTKGHNFPHSLGHYDSQCIIDFSELTNEGWDGARELTRVLQSLGFDGLIYCDTEIVSFDPENQIEHLYIRETL